MSDTPASNRVVWLAETQDPSKAEAVREALREVVDPEIGLNIIELGLIRDVDLQPDKAHVRMILTTPFCPYGPALIEETRKKVSASVGGEAAVEMSPEMWEPSMMEEGAGADWGLF
jgi:metal-sulfur cluster biosynthetic enzyme